MGDNNNDGWTVVVRQSQRGRRGRPGRRQAEQTSQASHFDVPAVGGLCRDFAGRLRACQQQLLDSSFWRSLLEAVREALADVAEWRGGDDAEIVCYGIGPFGQSPRAQYQLVCLLLLAAHLGVSRVAIFDPVLSPDEIEALALCPDYLAASAAPVPAAVVIGEDEHGRRTARVPTLFFMPHCNRELYENLLASNVAADTLHACVVVGNSFRVYHEQVVAADARAALRLVLAAYNAGMHHRSIEQFKPYFEAFNDTAVHAWTRTQASNLHHHFYPSIQSSSIQSSSIQSSSIELSSIQSSSIELSSIQSSQSSIELSSIQSSSIQSSSIQSSSIQSIESSSIQSIESSSIQSIESSSIESNER